MLVLVRYIDETTFSLLWQMDSFVDPVLLTHEGRKARGAALKASSPSISLHYSFLFQSIHLTNFRLLNLAAYRSSRPTSPSRWLSSPGQRILSVLTRTVRMFTWKSLRFMATEAKNDSNARPLPQHHHGATPTTRSASTKRPATGARGRSTTAVGEGAISFRDQLAPKPASPKRILMLCHMKAQLDRHKRSSLSSASGHLDRGLDPSMLEQVVGTQRGFEREFDQM